MVALTPSIVTDSVSRSVFARFESASWAWMLMPKLTNPVGVPQRVRGAVAQTASVPDGKSLAVQPSASVPVASNLMPCCLTALAT